MPALSSISVASDVATTRASIKKTIICDRILSPRLAIFITMLSAVLRSTSTRCYAWSPAVRNGRRISSTLSFRTTPASSRINDAWNQSNRQFSFQNNNKLYTQRTRCFASASLSSSENEEDNKKRKKKKSNKTPKKKGNKKKIKINPNISSEQAAKNLAAAFDDMAKKEGFGKSKSFFADAATFDDDFVEEDFEQFLDDDQDDDVGYELDASSQHDKKAGAGDLLDDDGGPVGQIEESKESMEARIAAAQAIDGSIPLQYDQVEDLNLDLDNDDYDDDIDLDMEARLAEAQRDLDRGRVSVDPGLGDISKEDMRRLGFKQELNPFQGDQTPRKEQFKLITNAMSCSACGADFQGTHENKPGYLPPEKYNIQVKLAHIEELQRLKEKAESAEWTPEDEVEWLLQTNGGDGDSQSSVDDIDIDAVAEELGLDLAAEMSKKKVICKRCHCLQNFGKVDTSLRPGWTDEPLLSQAKFRDLLRPLSTKPCVLIAIVDLFDFSGSVLPELDAIAGENPVILAANKADLLPSSMGQMRAENWVRRELEYMGIQSLSNIGGAVRLISCKTGMGVSAMLSKARKLADEMDCDIYIVGAANAGKSTLMNLILRDQEKEKTDGTVKRKKRAGNENAFKGALTTSPLPGTTLKFIKIDLGGRSLYDTPGLLVPGTLTQLLTPEELKIVVPTK
jgi:hypothetical protein